MKKMLFLLSVFFTVFMYLPAYADASSSNAVFAEFPGDYYATSSNAFFSAPETDFPVLGEITVFDTAIPLSLDDTQDFINVLRFDVTVGGTPYTLLFSPSYINQLFVDASGNLWNMGTSQVQGLVVDGSFNPYQDSGTLVYLAPCLGNNFSTNRNYGSPNWFRRYYWNYSSGSYRLTYDDTYVQILVTKSYFPFLFGDILQYVLIFLVGGGVLLCWLNRFRRY